jgi:hypothetical protein
MSSIDRRIEDVEQALGEAVKTLNALLTDLRHLHGVESGDSAAVARERRRLALLSTPALFAEWLHDECRRHTQPIATDVVPRQTGVLSVPLLCAYMTAARTEDARNSALAFVIDRFCVDHASLIDGRDVGATC